MANSDFCWNRLCLCTLQINFLDKNMYFKLLSYLKSFTGSVISEQCLISKSACQIWLPNFWTRNNLKENYNSKSSQSEITDEKNNNLNWFKSLVRYYWFTKKKCLDKLEFSFILCNIEFKDYWINIPTYIYSTSQTMWINSLVIACQNVPITFIDTETTSS